MQAIVFVAAFIVCVVVAWIVLAIMDAGERLEQELERHAPSIDVYLPVHLRAKVYDWAERGDFS